MPELRGDVTVEDRTYQVDALERLVIDRSAGFVDLERAWFAPQGWTADVADDDALARRLRPAND